MSIMKKLVGVFVEVDNPPPISNKRVEPQVVEDKQRYSTVYMKSNEEVDKFRDKFRDILEKENERNFPGHDYYEFVALKNAMDAIPQENLRYQNAFAGWTVVGKQTKQHLIDTANIYLGLVNKEIKDFEEAYKIQYDSQVVNNQKFIDQKTAEVQQLVQKMNLLNEEIQLLKQQNVNNTAALTTTHDAFMTAGEAQRQEIITEIEKINNYL